MRMSSFAALICAYGFSGSAQSACDVAAAPGAQLVELYTSQGCSSCPPADRWVNHLAADSKLIPLAFHVDYWDYLGWKDPFSQADFSARQRELARTAAATVYTPGVFLSGREWRNWGRETQSSSAQAATLGVRASLQLSKLQLEIQSTADSDVYAAISESGLQTRIRSGENAGSVFAHDHVVRVLAHPGAARSLALSIPADVQIKNAELVLWAKRGDAYVAALRTPLSACK
jgi:hypothetical protein